LKDQEPQSDPNPERMQGYYHKIQSFAYKAISIRSKISPGSIELREGFSDKLSSTRSHKFLKREGCRVPENMFVPKLRTWRELSDPKANGSCPSM